MTKQTVKYWLLYTAWSYVVLAAQLTLMPYISIGGIIPFLPPLLLGCLLAVETGPGALLYACLLGTWCDAFSQGKILFTLIYPAAALLIQYATRFFNRRSLFTAFLWSAGLSFGGQLLYCIIVFFIPGTADLSLLWRVLPLEMLLSLVFVPLIYPVMRQIARKYAQ